VLISLSDGSSFCVLDVARRRSLVEEGTTLSTDERNRLEEESEGLEAERKAVDLLSRSPHSRSGLRLKLLRRGFSEKAADRGLARMEELGYLDDAAFAEQWLAYRLERHPEGCQALLAGLLKRGIAADLARETIERGFSREQEEQCARRVLAKLRPMTRQSRTGVARKLSARGFSASLIYRIVEEIPGVPDSEGRDGAGTD